MSKVSQIYSEQPVSKEVAIALANFEEDISKAIQKAKQSGLPQGILTTILNMHHMMETQVMIDKFKGKTNG